MSRSWFRVERDWALDSKIVDLADRVGLAGISGWFVLLGRACQSEGVFPHPLAASLRAGDLGITAAKAKEIAAALVEIGLVEEDDEGCRISAWGKHQPPMRYSSHGQRGSAVDATTAPVAGSRRGVVTNERTDERTNRRTNGPAPIGEVIHTLRERGR